MEPPWQKHHEIPAGPRRGYYNDFYPWFSALSPAEQETYVLASPPPFEKGVTKTEGGEGGADVWRKGCFAWEYKGRRKYLDAAFAQLRQYSIARAFTTSSNMELS